MPGQGEEYVGRYRLRRRVGAGGMGSVWLADDEHLGIQVAVKQIELGEAVGEADRAMRTSRARREARNAVRLRGHPHVATVLDVVEQGGLPWIVMEYVADATDLAGVIRSVPRLPDSEICRIGVAVLKALSAGHGLDIVHRDVKPANILLAPDHSGNRFARVMLTDYGISLQSDSTQTRMTGDGFLGTPGYTAPERMRGDDRPISDLFSLGATLYCLSEGHGPFDREIPVASFAAALMDEPTAPRRAGPALADVILGLLRKDPQARLTAEDALNRLAAAERQALELAGAGTRTSFPPPATPTGSGGGLATSPDPGQGPLWKRLTGGESRRVSRKSVLVAMACVVLAASAWAVNTYGSSGSEDEKPSGDSGDSAFVFYSKDAGLTKPLKSGDCVLAQWPGGDYKKTPALRTTTCDATDTRPGGQAMATVPGEDAAAARQECSAQTKGIRKSLADPVLYTALPREGDQRTEEAACLVFQRHAAGGGPFGKYRKLGERLYENRMGAGDCLETKVTEDSTGKLYEPYLADCAKPHAEEVVGSALVEKHDSYEEAFDAGVGACRRKFENQWVRNDDQEIIAWMDEDDWKRDFLHVTCALVMKDDGKLPASKSEPTLEHSSARYAAPSDGGAGSLSYTVDVSDDSGVRGLKVIAWPASSKLDPTEAELRSVDSAKCQSTSDETTRCTYTLKVTKEEAAELDKGTWYVSALATAEDGDTTFEPHAATFDVTG